MKEWIAKRVTQLLGGLEEEVLIGLIYNLLELPEVRANDVLLATLPQLSTAEARWGSQAMTEVSRLVRSGPADKWQVVIRQAAALSRKEHVVILQGERLPAAITST
jgi:hypothetical protein